MPSLFVRGKALQDLAIAYNIPIISGKDSMKNDYGSGKHKVSIPPTFLFTALATSSSYHQVITSDFKLAGSSIYLLGQTKAEMGGSECYLELGLDNIGSAPTVNAKINFCLYQRMYRAIKRNLLASCHDLSDGGLAIALAESALGGMVGVEVELTSSANISIGASNHKNNPWQKISDLEKMFSESQGRFIVEISPKKEKSFLKFFKGMSMMKLGYTRSTERFLIKNRQKILIDVTLQALKTAWTSTFDF